MEFERETMVARRSFLLLSLAAMASLGMSFDQTSEVPKAVLKMEVPDDDDPKNGRYVLNIEANYLKNRPVTKASLHFRPTAEMSFWMEAQMGRLYLSNTLIEVGNQERGDDLWEDYMIAVDYTKPHLLIVSWDNWKFSSYSFDGASKTLPIKRQYSNLDYV